VRVFRLTDYGAQVHETNPLAALGDMYPPEPGTRGDPMDPAYLRQAPYGYHNPYNVQAGGGGSQMPIPSKYRYIRQYVVMLPGLLGYGETNWIAPTVAFANPTNYQGVSYPFESQCGQGNNFAGMYNAWTGFPNVWVRTLYDSGSSRKGIVWKMTNSVALPAQWWTNATSMPSDCFFFLNGNVINADISSKIS
jgi:hypothetical protein